MNEHKIAEALGLVRSDKMMRCPVTYPNLGQNLITTAYCWLADGKPFCAVDNFGTWLASPAGEKTVRNKVRELWVVGYGDGQWLTYEAVNRPMGGHRVYLWRVPAEDIEHPMKSFAADTEGEAYAAAVIWLAEKDTTPGLVKKSEVFADLDGEPIYRKKGGD